MDYLRWLQTKEGSERVVVRGLLARCLDTRQSQQLAERPVELKFTRLLTFAKHKQSVRGAVRERTDEIHI